MGLIETLRRAERQAEYLNPLETHQVFALVLFGLNIRSEMMQIEQPAELNKHVDPSIPLTWAYRWQALKPTLPLLLCCSIYLNSNTCDRQAQISRQ